MDHHVDEFPFNGFLPPVANPPAVNRAHAGQTVPIRFGLGGDRGLGVIAPGYPTAQHVDCTTGAPLDPPTPTSSPGHVGLRYDDSTGVYTYLWKTDRAYALTCQVLTLGLVDGSTHTALFRFG
ncbi:PxKF domain-containing protein [Kitasatospora sp. NPDC048286]|uniref:PxKF domain-containing protein n=1 Tax=Kitasatospora sp. NPDC048286 TaxID=3364047 RepID=UPI00371373D7